MDWVMIGKLVGILLLVAGNAFFVGSEIALTSARRSRIKQLAGTGNKSAKIVQLLHNEPERFYSVTQIGITLVSLALGAIGMVTLTQIFDPGIVAAFGVFGDSPRGRGMGAHLLLRRGFHHHLIHARGSRRAGPQGAGLSQGGGHEPVGGLDSSTRCTPRCGP